MSTALNARLLNVFFYTEISAQDWDEFDALLLPGCGDEQTKGGPGGGALSLAVLDSSWRYDAGKTSDFQTRVVGYLTTRTTDLEAGLRGWMADALFAAANANSAVKAPLEIVLGGHLAKGRDAFFANPLSAATPSPLAETRLAELAMPTLVIVGELDDPEFRAHSDAVAAAVSGAQKVVIAGSGHMSTMEKPDEVNRALAAFLAK